MSVPARTDLAADERDADLRQGVLPLWAVFGVAVGVLAPASTLALAIGVVGETAGNLSWLTWVITSVIMLGFAGGISALARRFASTGGLYGLAAKGGGRPGGFLVSATQVTAVLLSGPACALGSVIYLQQWLTRVGLPGNRWTLAAYGVVVVMVLGAMCYREVKLSAKVLLAIEFTTVGVIGALFAVVLVRAPGGVVDGRQFSFHGASVTTILAAAGFSVFSMAGFEHAATLGREARRPRRAIATAMFGSIVVVGVLYVIGAYVVVLGFRGLSFTGVTAPLDTLADRNHVGWLGYLIDLGVAVSFFGSALGIMAGTSRTLYTLARDRVLPARLSRLHRGHATPVAAVGVLVVLYLVITVAGALAADADTAYGYLGTLAGYLLVAAYGIATVAAVVCAVRTRSVRAGIALAALVAVAGMVCVYYFSLHPFPTGGYGVVAWIFLTAVAVSVLLYVALRLIRPAALDRIGRSERDARRTA